MTSWVKNVRFYDELSILVTLFGRIIPKTMLIIKLYYFPLAFYTKTSISDQPVIDFTPGHKANWVVPMIPEVPQHPYFIILNIMLLI